jgi:hypothetical protein
MEIEKNKSISNAEHLAGGCSFKSAARQVKVDPETVRRMNRVLGRHSQQFYDKRVWDVAVSSVQNRKTLAFSRHSTAKLALGWWTLTVYNRCRAHRMLRSKVDQF